MGSRASPAWPTCVAPGLLIAAELDEGIDARQVAAAALASGLSCHAVTPTALRLAPSLLISDEEIDEGVGILGEVLLAVGAGPTGGGA